MTDPYDRPFLRRGLACLTRASNINTYPLIRGREVDFDSPDVALQRRNPDILVDERRPTFLGVAIFKKFRHGDGPPTRCLFAGGEIVDRLPFVITFGRLVWRANPPPPRQRGFRHFALNPDPPRARNG